MKVQFAYKFKDGTIAVLPAYDSYDLSKPENGDFLKLMIKGKMDNQNIEISGRKFKYNDLNSIEIVFVD